jgi:2-hydroxychromene-2-carboxylate isomerase
MKTIDFYLDFISPYAYLAFEELPRALTGLSYRVVHKPLLFAGLLKHHGQLGPAEIAAKRDWTYRQVLWLAHERGVPMQMPASHPFNPLPYLRLALACSEDGQPNRYVCETVFHALWRGGRDAADAAVLTALTERLAPRLEPGSEAVKTRLREHTEQALARGVFGVPSFVVDGRVFWGLDALPMLRAHLQGDAWLDAHWDAPSRVAVGVRR